MSLKPNLKTLRLFIKGGQLVEALEYLDGFIEKLEGILEAYEGEDADEYELISLLKEILGKTI